MCGCASNANALLYFRQYSYLVGYAKNDLVQYGDVVYCSLHDGNQNHQPDISPAHWNPTSVSTLLTQILNALS